MKSMKALVCLIAWLIAGLTAPSMLQARDVSPEVEEQLMGRLTETEMEEFLAGVDPSEIPLASGETLDDLLRQLEARERQGLLFYPVTPCTLLDTSEEGRALEDGERRPLWLRSEKQTSSSGDDRTCGADLDETSARVALLTVQLLESPGYGSLWIGPGDEREGSRLHLAPTATNGWTVTSELCDSSSEDACPEGDLRVSVEGTAARVVVHFLGFYGPPLRSPPTRDRPSEEPTESGEVERKASTSPFWEVGTGSGEIHYSDGFVGIGTENPSAPLEILGPNLDYPYNRALRIETFGESPSFRDHVSISGEAESGYGIAFGGLGHHRGGLYARNTGGTSRSEGEITLWARSGGNLRLLGGNVGIGRDPLAKLHVGGDLRLDLGEGLLFLQSNDYWKENQDARRIQIRDVNLVVALENCSNRS